LAGRTEAPDQWAIGREQESDTDQRAADHLTYRASGRTRRATELEASASLDLALTF
jgi:hypothetical protein